MAKTLLLIFTIHLWLAAPAGAQILQADWTQEADRLIEQHRKAPVRVIVLDRAGRPVANAAVRFEQKRHAFAWGAVPSVAGRENAFFKGQNAISLDAWYRWSILEPKRGELAPPPPIGDWDSKWRVRYGAVASGDPARLPDWLVSLRGDELRQSLEARLLRALDTREDEFDIYADSINHDFVADRLGIAMVRRMFERAKAERPEARMCVRFADGLEGQRTQKLVASVTGLRDALVPIDAIAIDARFTGTVTQASVKRQLDWVAALKMPIVISRLEVAGASEAAAAINLETVLRTFFAEPMVSGVYLVGFDADQVSDPTALLKTESGSVTDSGRLLQNLVTKTWWTDAFAKSDHLGNAKLRVFAGLYELTAALPGAGGVTATTTVYLPPDQPERIVVLQPLDPKTDE